MKKIYITYNTLLAEKIAIHTKNILKEYGYNINLPYPKGVFSSETKARINKSDFVISISLNPNKDNPKTINDDEKELLYADELQKEIFVLTNYPYHRIVKCKQYIIVGKKKHCNCKLDKNWLLETAFTIIYQLIRLNNIKFEFKNEQKIKR